MLSLSTPTFAVASTGETIGANKTGLFRVDSKALAAADAQIWVTRVVARKY